MFEDNRWRRMLKPGITAIVGAGGKTTVLERLGTYGHGGHLPIMVSSIVPMDSTRVDNVEPFDVICTEDMEKGESFCAERIAAGHVPAWFAGLDDQDRYIGLQPKVIDDIKMRHPAWYILIEGDAAGNKWLKAPLADDVPLPASCDTVIGVLNLQMLGNVISDEKNRRRRNGSGYHGPSLRGCHYTGYAGQAHQASPRLVPRRALPADPFLHGL